jgi:hypothetical protein
VNRSTNKGAGCDAVVCDVNGDGYRDIYVVQRFNDMFGNAALVTSGIDIAGPLQFLTFTYPPELLALRSGMTRLSARRDGDGTSGMQGDGQEP